MADASLFPLAPWDTPVADPCTVPGPEVQVSTRRLTKSPLEGWPAAPITIIITHRRNDSSQRPCSAKSEHLHPMMRMGTRGQNKAEKGQDRLQPRTSPTVGTVDSGLGLQQSAVRVESGSSDSFVVGLRDACLPRLHRITTLSLLVSYLRDLLLDAVPSLGLSQPDRRMTDVGIAEIPSPWHEHGKREDEPCRPLSLTVRWRAIPVHLLRPVFIVRGGPDMLSGDSTGRKSKPSPLSSPGASSTAVDDKSHVPLQTPPARLCNLQLLLGGPVRLGEKKKGKKKTLDRCQWPSRSLLTSDSTRPRRTKSRHGGAALQSPACHWPQDKAAEPTNARNGDNKLQLYSIPNAHRPLSRPPTTAKRHRIITPDLRSPVYALTRHLRVSRAIFLKILETPLQPLSTILAPYGDNLFDPDSASPPPAPQSAAC
ncbi:hypothetical protein CMUS01_05579 [Colletotrichum musicola]|uniref:Uncharacterized protein n=1 Tax=Colletotrichum musicola TaxID=2175873 RepID=A0A8H6NJS2_9PEZI|nr:hypothetical protein CMUS01_05579 [Colletotrichum musicola]